MSQPEQTYTLSEIKQLCIAYDRKYGEYKESVFEGKSLWEWISTLGEGNLKWWPKPNNVPNVSGNGPILRNGETSTITSTYTLQWLASDFIAPFSFRAPVRPPEAASVSLPTIESSEKPYRSAQDTLIRAMEEFAISEPKGIVIIHTDEAGELVINGNTGKCLALGMIETAKNMILRGEA